MAAKPFAFVLMPFSQEFDDVYKIGIQEIAAQKGIKAERVDEQIYSETILERIYRQISDCDFIIADMTGRNPNVFYEVGFAHAKGKVVTLLTQSADDIPFDLRNHRHLIYNGSINLLREYLSSEFDWHLSELKKRRGQRFSIELASIFGDLIATDWSHKAIIDLRIDLRNRSDRRSPDFDVMYVYTGKNWRLKQSEVLCPYTDSDVTPYSRRHFINIPVRALGPGGWAQVSLRGEKIVWSKFAGDEKQEKYQVSGALLAAVETPEGVVRERLHIDVSCQEMPF